MKTPCIVVIAGLGIALCAASAQVEQPLRCAATGYTATYSPESSGLPPMVDVIFRGTKPTSAVAEAALRKCLQEVADTMFITSEVVATALFGKTKADAEPVRLSDSSDHLLYDLKTKRMLTWNQREGITPTVSEAAGLFVEYQEEETYVKPVRKFATVSVVFANQTTEKIAYETAIAELTKAVQRTRGAMKTTAYVYVGTRENPASRVPVKGSNGKDISAEFDPKNNGRVETVFGDDLHVQIPVTK